MTGSTDAKGNSASAGQPNAVPTPTTSNSTDTPGADMTGLLSSIESAEVKTAAKSEPGKAEPLEDLVIAHLPDTTKYRKGDKITFDGLVVALDGKDVTSRARLSVEAGTKWSDNTKKLEVEVAYRDASGQDHMGRFELKRKMRKAPIILLILVLLIAATIGGFILLDPWGDPRAKKGYYEGKTQEEIERDLNEQVDWYSMQMSCAPYAVLSPGSTQAKHINLENIEANHCDQVVTITLKGSNEKIFESKAIAPGYYIEDIELNRSFDEGVYVAIVEFQGYELNGRFGGDGQIWGHDKFGAPSRVEILLIVTDDMDVARATAAYYLETGQTQSE